MTTIETTKGPMDVALLDKRTGTTDNEVELTHWTEYWLLGDTKCAHELKMPSRMCVKCPAELVHRSVHMTLKQASVCAESAVGSFA